MRFVQEIAHHPATCERSKEWREAVLPFAVPLRSSICNRIALLSHLLSRAGLTNAASIAMAA
jgi:hypothetical protein